jgi:FtsP/CotA-like multicopper oxidase with cupredoxin domain
MTFHFNFQPPKRRISIENRLASESISSTASAALILDNSFRRPNNTKLEFYGLHATISTFLSQSLVPVDADSLITPGGSLTYVLKIREDHPPGLHWYHANAPGSASLQVAGGMVGTITVEPANDTVLPNWLNKLRVDSMLIVFTHIMLDAAAPAPPTILQSLLEGLEAHEVMLRDYFAVAWPYTRLADAAGSKLPLNAVYHKQNDSALSSESSDEPIYIRDAWFANGQYQPLVSLKQGRWQILDMVAASADRLLELEIRKPPPPGSTSIINETAPGACEMQLLAVDGVYLKRTRNVTHFPLIQGSRASMAVRCMNNGTFYLISASTLDPEDPFSRVGSMESKSLQVLVIFNVTRSESSSLTAASDITSDDLPSDLSMVPRFTFKDAKSAIKPLSIAVEQGGCCGEAVDSGGKSLFWLGLGTDCSVPCVSTETCALLYGHSYTVAKLPSVAVGKCSYASYSAMDDRNFTGSEGAVPVRGMAQDVMLWGSLEAPVLAPLTMQRQHFQIMSYDNANMDTHYQGESQAARAIDLSSLFGEPGDWRDTWPMLPGRTHVRAVFDDTDSILFRTTALKYADRGMQARVQIASQYSVESIGSALQNDTSNKSVEIQSSALPAWFTSANYCAPSGESWSYREEIDHAHRLRIITTNMCPNHFSACQLAECGGPLATFAKKQLSRIEVPLYPKFSETATDTTCWGSSAVGIALNGVGIYGPSAGSIDADGDAVGTYVCGTPAKYGSTTKGVRTPCNLNGQNDGTRYCGDAVTKYGRGFDMCGGRADLSLGVYKYHTVPVCLLKQLTTQGDIDGSSFQLTGGSIWPTSVSNGTTYAVASNGSTTTAVGLGGDLGDGINNGWVDEGFIDLGANNSASTPVRVSPQIGWALDGFPIYGPYGPHGQLMRPCGSRGAHPIICLDECNGFKASLPGVVTLSKFDRSKHENEDLRVELAWGDGFSYRYYMSGPTASGECSAVVDNAGECLREDSKCCLSTVPSKSFFPYSIGCLRGCLADSSTLGGFQGSCSYSGESGTTEAYVPSVSLHPSSVYIPLSDDEIAARLRSANANRTNTTHPHDTELSRQKTLLDFQRGIGESARKVLVRFPNQTVSIITSVAGSVEGAYSGIDPSSPYPSFSTEELPTGSNDSIITGLTVDPDTNK